MALKSQVERINDLEKLVAVLIERLDVARNELEGIDAGSAAVATSLAELKTQFALLVKDVEGVTRWKDELKRERDEAGRRLWAFGPNLVAALISGVISGGSALLVWWLNQPR